MNYLNNSIRFYISDNKKMKALFIDELRLKEIKNVEDYLINNTITSHIQGLYWLILPEEILTEEQIKIQKNQGPLKTAIEVGKTWVKFELLIRTTSIENIGSSYVNDKQLIYIYNYVNNIIKLLNITTCN
jgi:hypothetical protein